MKRSFLTLLCLLIVAGCGQEPKKYDLGTLVGKVSKGMTEVQVTQAIGVPTSIEVGNGIRALRYGSLDGKSSLLISVKGNVVVDVSRS